LRATRRPPTATLLPYTTLFRSKGQELANEFAGQFWDLLVTSHPYGMPGEVRGKSSNEDWAARRAVEELVDREGLNIDHLTVTSRSEEHTSELQLRFELVCRLLL